MAPVTPAYMEGEFDSSRISEKLLELGYEQREASGFTYYTIREDYQSTQDPDTQMAFNFMNRVYADDERVITAPSTDMIESILEAIAGERPSLADAPAFANLAMSLGNPLSAAILERPLVLEPDATEYEKPEGWGELHQWETAGFGLEIEADGTRKYIYALYYPDPVAAEADAAELLARMQDYTSTLPQRFDVEKLFEVCELSVSHTVHNEGSTVTTMCEAEEGERVVPWWLLVDSRDLGFLVP
jgi:hypothetical protein